MNHTIIVTEDDAVQREIISDILASAGYAVQQCASGLETLDTLRKDACDLILTDMKMPEMDGLETLQALRELDPDVRVLVASGFSISLDIDTLRAHGALDFLSKPFRVSEISRKVAELIQAPPE